MQDFFKSELIHDGDTYVADYTEPENVGGRPDGRGVVISGDPLDRSSFKLTNASATRHVAASIEHFPADFCVGENCEAVLFSLHDADGTALPWILLVELKYCHKSIKENSTLAKIDENYTKAFSQLEKTLDNIRNKFGVSHLSHRLFFNIHFPWLEEYSPFSCSYWDPGRLADIRSNLHVNLYGCPVLVADSPYSISEPD